VQGSDARRRTWRLDGALARRQAGARRRDGVSLAVLRRRSSSVVAGGRGVAATYTDPAGDGEPMGGRETGFTGGRHDGQKRQRELVEERAAGDLAGAGNPSRHAWFWRQKRTGERVTLGLGP
jgi:hypothetical protein